MDQQRARKDFKEPPRYGTVREKFTQGQEGLMTADSDEDEKAARLAVQNDDWGLTYGKKKKKKVVPVSSNAAI